MEIKSQICTSIEQSKRLLELGLKPETADMRLIPYTKFAVPMKYNDGFFYDDKDYTPAWSMHRLIEIAEVSVEVSGLFVRISSTYYYEEKDNVYDNLIDAIRELINNDVFNKEYLKL